MVLWKKRTRTAVAVAVGAIAIVLAIIFSSNQTRTPTSEPARTKQVIPAERYSDGTYSCPSGFKLIGSGYCREY